MYEFKLNKEYSFFKNRIIYRIDKKFIDIPNSFFLKTKKQRNLNFKYNKIIFVSQPYYIDYDLDFNSWVAKLNSCLSKFKDKGFSVYIKYHQRDSDEFKKFIANNNYIEFNETVKDPVMYVGLFSTYLFELNLSGFHVVSIFNHFESLFPNEYLKFVKSISKHLSLNLEGKRKWNLTNKDMYKLFDLIKN